MKGLKQSTQTHVVFMLCILSLLVLPNLVASECTCDKSEETHDKAKALRFKIVALVSILMASTIGVCIPLLGKIIPAISPEKDVFFLIKAFAAGVILATGFIHVLPDAFENLTSPCLSDHPWGDFPFTGFVAMCTSMGTLMVDAYATAYFQKSHLQKAQVAVTDVEKEEEHVENNEVDLHTHVTHGHAHGHVSSNKSSELLRHRVISQVLELGIVVHSVVIGITLGASMNSETIRPLVAALTFHQFFEGMGLGSCITQRLWRHRHEIAAVSARTAVGQWREVKLRWRRHGLRNFSAFEQGDEKRRRSTASERLSSTTMASCGGVLERTM
ncbi:zinc transporter 1 isoform X4 [Arachis hypogaea]|uniref:zinc transporter 1 isoform X4 n=1 Tax=Arachis hypogaea TaxID=3818 RepID=UPI000DEC8D55|nr:zinc transporter 1 isoform X2 [Arachis hypogaea]QHO36934.1 Zinc transporter [Arachis hypogaea]